MIPNFRIAARALNLRFFPLILAGIVMGTLSCTKSIQLSIEQHTVKTPEQEELHFYIGRKPGSALSTKLLVVIQGSGRESIQRRFGLGSEATMVGFDVLYMEKYAYDNERLFRKTDCRERRVKDILFIVNHVLKDLYQGNVKEVGILADSEGGGIAPEIAHTIKNTKYLLIFGAGGFSQAREMELLLERARERNEEGMLQRAGIHTKEQLFNKFEEIRNDPTTEKVWLGHTHKRWNSYLFYSPESVIEALEIPTLVIIGEEDRSVPAESVRALQARLKNKGNFRFHIIPGLDHNFRDHNGNRKMNDILKAIVIPWYRKAAS